MICPQNLIPLAADCSGSMGGIKRIWFHDYADGSYTFNTLTEAVYTFPTADWCEFSFRKNTGNFTSTLTKDDANGVNYVTTEINLVFSKMEVAKRLSIAALTQADVLAVVEDTNGNFWCFGEDEPVTMSAGTGQTGTAKGDGNNYSITLTVDSKEWPRALDASTIDDFLTYVTATSTDPSTGL